MRIRALALVAAVALLSAACGDDADSTTTDTTAATTTTSTDDGSTTSTSAAETDEETIALSAYFLDDAGHVRVGWEREVPGPAVADALIEDLLAGPTGDDESLGLHTAIPDGTTLNSVTVEDDATGVVDLSAEFGAGGDDASAKGRLAQVVYAMTQFPTVEQVEILVDGEPLTTVGDSSIPVDGALTRVDFQFGGPYQGVEDNVLVETPRPGAVIEGPTVDVGGSANTFEGTVYLEAVASDGTVLVPEQFTTATSGSGTPGTFYHPVTFPDGTTGDVVIRAYELSGEDGSRRALNEVPITLE
jgi:spore germination protein GerM